VRVPDVYVCDGCGRTRGPSNHWWMLIRAMDKESLYLRGVQLIEWDASLADDEKTKHLCGSACVIRVIDGLMGKRQLAGDTNGTDCTNGDRDRWYCL
jgi:hypothetical protein